ncbi:translation initiation factor IF-3 [Candidatus Parcubacteria bacterium 4484_255]|nr:MAG: translation initiation factor IF-3 [Candidatus Parcubacteria bacterium 4484_255]
MKYYRVNNKITAPQVRLINEKGEHLDVIKTEKALEMAREKKLDLVEISPQAKPPVAKILNFSRLKYNLKKKEKQQKKERAINEVKGIRLTPRIGKHDLDFRVKRAREFMDKGNKVKIEMILRGREKAHFPLAQKLTEEFISMLGENIQIEQKIKRQGNRLTVLISKK